MSLWFILRDNCVARSPSAPFDDVQISFPGERQEPMATREHWSGRFGFIMATAGSAVGLGNVWKFPYEAGQNGGGAFLLLYLSFVALFGLSLVMAELVLGRTTQRNPVGAFAALGGKGWSVIGGIGVLAGFVILSFYIVVAGWTLAYLGFMVTGSLGADAAALGERFGAFVSSPISPIAYAALFLVICVGVVIGGVNAGIEKASRILMPALFVLLLILVLRSVTLPGAEEGLRYFLQPDWSKVTMDTISSAIGQAFFSLSLGMGCLITYGSYLRSNDAIAGSATIVVGLDTLVAVLAGLMILPAVFAFGFDPSAGPGLTFITLPAVFAQMPGGAFFGIAFFGLLAVAALTSAISLLEVVVCYFTDEHGLSRRKATILVACIAFLLGIPASLSLGVWSAFTVPGTEKGIFDFMDFTASNVMLPLGGLLTAVFVGWRWSEPAREALHAGGVPPALTSAWIFILRFVAPPGIGYILYGAI